MASIRELADWIRAHDDIAVVPHVNPDGDALCSGMALCRMLTGLGKRAFVCSEDPVPHMYAFLPGQEMIYRPSEAPFVPRALLFEDVADFHRAGDRGKLTGLVKDWAQIDHHETNPRYAQVNVVDGAASATGVMAMRLLDEMGAAISEEMALYLYIAISTDTGNFSYSNTSPEAMRDVARLLEAGLDIDTYSRLTFRLRSVPRLRLLAKAIDGMRLGLDGRFAYARIAQEMFDECGASAPDTEGIVSTLADMEGVQVAMTIEARDGGASTKFSLRSVGDIDVAAIARSFGGGGHKNAAGMNLPCPVQEAEPLAIAAVEAALKG